MMLYDKLIDSIIKKFPDLNLILRNKFCSNHEINLIIVGTNKCLEILTYLKSDPNLLFQQLIDLVIVDYLNYDISAWPTIETTNLGFNWSINPQSIVEFNPQKFNLRFGICYHLLSLVNNFRIIIEFLFEQDNITIPSCVELWPGANWYEREAFDLFGIGFSNHPELKRLLNEDDFKGNPLRKDFIINPNMEARFDAKLKKIVTEDLCLNYNPICPKIIRYKDFD